MTKAGQASKKPVARRRVARCKTCRGFGVLFFRTYAVRGDGSRLQRGFVRTQSEPCHECGQTGYTGLRRVLPKWAEDAASANQLGLPVSKSAPVAADEEQGSV